MRKVLLRMSIGSNNETKQLESSKITDMIAARYPAGWKAYQTLGGWATTREDSMCVEVVRVDEPEERVKFYQVARSLCVLLDQDSIMVETFSKDGYDCDFVSATD